jgi:hypothetical protein
MTIQGWTTGRNIPKVHWEMSVVMQPLPCRRVRTALGEALRAGRAPRAEVQTASGGAAEALQAASDAAHGRWAKLLAAR